MGLGTGIGFTEELWRMGRMLTKKEKHSLLKNIRRAKSEARQHEAERVVMFR